MGTGFKCRWPMSQAVLTGISAFHLNPGILDHENPFLRSLTMKKLVLSLFLSVFILSIPLQGPAFGSSDPEFKRIKAEELKKLVEDKSKVIVIDSRDSGKYSKGHIEGAVNIHYDASGDPMSRQMTLMALPLDRIIVIYCGCKDEKTAEGLALELYDMGCDMENLRILSGGINKWKDSGYPLKTAD